MNTNLNNLHYLRIKNILFLLILFSTYSNAQNISYELTNLDTNDSSSQYGLIPYLKDKVIFSAPIMDNENLRLKAKNGGLIYSLFEGTKASDGQIIDIEKFGIINGGRFNISSAVVSPNGKHLYITANYNYKNPIYKKKDKNFNLYLAKGEYIEGEGWTNFERLSFCKLEYSYAHPAISLDGTTLFFVSNLPSAKGPSDIFRVSILGNSEFSKPENLGPLVNSVRKETFPFMSKDGTLYFSSNRAYGFGGLDLYSSKLGEDNKFEKAKLLPKPLNSRADDFCFTIDSDKKEGYFSSKRAGGKGDDDIYYFKINNESNTESELKTN